MKSFRHASVLPGTVADSLAVHAEPGTFAMLTMPPLILRVLRDTRTSLTEGEIEFRLWFGPVPVRWLARHEPGPVAASFKDVQVKGPLAHWAHEHIFEPAPGGTLLTDHITYQHRPGWRGLLTRLFFDGLPLKTLFLYRHWRTRRALLSRTRSLKPAA